jgi:hypothetical protein
MQYEVHYGNYCSENSTGKYCTYMDYTFLVLGNFMPLVMYIYTQRPFLQKRERDDALPSKKGKSGKRISVASRYGCYMHLIWQYLLKNSFAPKS